MIEGSDEWIKAHTIQIVPATAEMQEIDGIARYPGEKGGVYVVGPLARTIAGHNEKNRRPSLGEWAYWTWSEEDGEHTAERILGESK